MDGKFRRIILGSVMLVFLFSGVVTVVVAEGRHIPAWRTAFVEALPGVQMAAVQRAKYPAQFDDNRSAFLPIDLGTFAYTTSATYGKPIRYTLALPATPSELYCVIGKRGNGTQLYLVGYFDDGLWHADWVVWMGSETLGDRVVQQALTAIGCSMALSTGS